MTAIAGIAVAALLWWLLKGVGKAGPQKAVQFTKLVGGALALLVAGLLLLKGRMDMAALLGGAAAWLLGWAAPPSWWPFSAKATRLASRTLEVRLGPSHAMTGRVLAGEFAGRALQDLTVPELRRLRNACLAGDVEGARLVEAYLDRRFPAWREDAERGSNLGDRADVQHGAMTQQEAYEILGLQPGAGPDEIRSAHRRLMKTLHPDGGGSTYLASRVNQAKDLLLDRHR